MVFGSSLFAASIARMAASKRASDTPPTLPHMSTALDDLVAAVDTALADDSLRDDPSRVDAFRPQMASLLADADPLPAWAYEPLDGGAVGNLLHSDPASRFHILAVVFP